MLSRLCAVVLCLLFAVGPVCSQKQVTIDRSRLAQDRSRKEAAQRQQEAKKKRTVAQAESRKSAKRQRQKRVERPKVATYLSVNNSYSELKEEVWSWSRDMTFYVNTDGRSWSVHYLPSWCKVTSYSGNSFVLSVTDNNSYDIRQDWFTVSSDDKSVKVTITQDAKRINVSATVNNVSLTHNVVVNGNECMMVSGSFNVTGGEGLRFYAVAQIKSEYGGYVNASSLYPSYRMKDGSFYAAAETTPSYNNATTHSFKVAIPNNAFLPGYNKTNKLRLVVSLYCEKKGEYVAGATRFIPFVAKKKKSGVKTKDD